MYLLLSSHVLVDGDLKVCGFLFNCEWCVSQLDISCLMLVGKCEQRCRRLFYGERTPPCGTPWRKSIFLLCPGLLLLVG